MYHFSKNVCLTIMIIIMVVFFMGCKTPAVSKGESAEATPMEVPAPVDEKPAPSHESSPAAETPFEEPIEKTPIVHKFYLAGSYIDLVALDGRAEIKYPAAMVTTEDVEVLFANMFESYPEIKRQLSYEIPEEGKVVIRYPQQWGETELIDFETKVFAYVNNLLDMLRASTTETADGTPFIRVYNLLGYELIITAKDGYAEIVYPEFVTSDDLKGFFTFLKEEYGLLIRDVVYENPREGLVIINYPASWSDSEFNQFAEIAEDYAKKEVDKYLSSLLPEPEVVTLELFDYEAKLTFNGKSVFVDYPDFITQEEIRQAASVAMQNYRKYFEGCTLVIGDGEALLTFPVEITSDDFHYGVEFLKAILPSYIESVFAQIPESQEQPAEEPAEETPIVHRFYLAGSFIDLVALNGRAEINYPAAMVTTEDVEVLFANMFESYPEIQGQLSYEIPEEGKVVVRYPQQWGEMELRYAEEKVFAYVNNLLDMIRASSEEKAEEPSEQSVTEEFRIFGYTIKMTLLGDSVLVEYPAFITTQEVKDAAAAAYQAYGQYLQGVQLTIGKGDAILSFPAELSEADFRSGAKLFADALPAYIASVYDAAAAATAATTETPAAEQPAEAPAAEQPAEAPAEETPIVHRFYLAGSFIDLVALNGRAEINYPAAMVTTEDVEVLFANMFESYPEIKGQLSYEIPEEGKAVIFYPQQWGETELRYAEEKVFAYVNNLLDMIRAANTVYSIGYDVDCRGPVNFKAGDINGIEIEDPEREHYEFVGWHLSCASDELLGLGSIIGSRINLLGDCEVNPSIDSDFKLVAEWKADVYRLSYNLNGGSFQVVEEVEEIPEPVEEQTEPEVEPEIEYGYVLPSSIEKPDSYTVENPSFILDFPVRDGYWFKGWKSADEAVSFAKLIKYVDTSKGSDNEFEAEWEPVTYSVVCNTGEEISVLQYTVEDSLLNIDDPVRNHYEFAGWIVSGRSRLSGKTDLFSLETDNGKIIVRFDPDFSGEDRLSLFVRILEEYPEFENYLAGSIRRDGSYEIRLLDNPDFENDSVTLAYCCNLLEQLMLQAMNSAEITKIEEPVTGLTLDASSKTDYLIQAVWRPLEYRILCNFDGGYLPDGSVIPEVYTVEDNPFDLPVPERNGYEFLGWVREGDSNALIDCTVDTSLGEDLSFTAAWVPVVYSVAYEFCMPSDEIPDEMFPGSYTIEDAVAVPALERHDYDFEGWVRTDDIEEKTVRYFMIEKGSTGDISLKAVWKWNPVVSEIVYELNGGTVSDANPVSFTVDDEPFVLRNPSRDMYEFLGWRLSGCEKTEPVQSFIVDTSVEGNLAIEAVWTPVSYSIRYDLAGGAFTRGIACVSYDCETEDFVLSIPEKENCDFLGWLLVGSENPVPEKQYSIKKGTAGDLKFIACWQWREVPVGSVTKIMKQTPEYGNNGIPRPDWVIKAPSEPDFHYEIGYCKDSDISFYDKLTIAVSKAMDRMYEWAGLDKNSGAVVAGREVVEYWEDSDGGVWVLVRVASNILAGSEKTSGTSTNDDSAAPGSAAAASSAASAATAAKKSNAGVIILIVALVIAVAAAALVILKKKKK